MEHNFSLNQLAIVLGVPAARLQSAQVAYKPIPGEPYEAKKINWDAVDGFVERRLDKTGYESVEAIYEAARAVEYVPKKGNRTKDPNSVYGKVLFGTTPVRKGAIEAGSKIVEKKTGKEFTVIFATPTIVCYDSYDDEGNALTCSVGNRTFNGKFDIVE